MQHAFDTFDIPWMGGWVDEVVGWMGGLICESMGGVTSYN